jgi:hypothetical protein
MRSCSAFAVLCACLAALARAQAQAINITSAADLRQALIDGQEHLVIRDHRIRWGAS